LENIPDENIKWSVWILLGDTWTKMTKNSKTGATVDYTFTQTSLKRKGIRMLVDANGEKAVLDIKTKNNSESKILHIEILDNLGKKPTKLFSYGETITARVHCLNMEKFRINVTLWENDGGKKDLSDIVMDTKEANVLQGKADVEFTFDPSKVWLANAKSAPGESNEGAFHEYYVTAEFYKKVSKPTQDVNVINPDYKVDIFSKTSTFKPSETETQKTSPKEQKGASKKETRGIAKKDEKAHDYHEQKVDIQPTIVFNPNQEFINSLMMVDVGDSMWHQKKGICICKENNFYWSNKLTCDERKKVLEVCAKLWGEDKKKDKASELMAIMHLETGKKDMFKPYADNGADYSGLIQFNDASAKKLGTTRSALKKMTFIEQMDYVHDYFASKQEIANMVDLYLHVLKPNAVGNGNNPDYVLFDESISVPDGDGSQTSAEQRKINIGKEPWVTKYGYSSNPSFMKGEEHTQRRKWVYTRQRFEERWGFVNGKTTIADVMLELNKEHYNPGVKELFKGVCENAKKEDNQKENTGERAPWMKIAWEEETKKLKETGSNKEIQKFFDGTPYEQSMKNGTTNESDISWCATFVNWVMTKYGYKGVEGYNAVRALKWADWAEGVDIKKPIYGAIAVKRRTGGGHVGFVAGKKGNKIVILGGNQNNALNCSKYSESEFFAYLVPKDYEVFDEDYKLPEYEGNPNEKGSES
jgi:uncharacterized protein (TIGR02594 family)